MEIILTYKGIIPANNKPLDAVWKMRKSFDTQLKKLWGKEPFAVLKKWEDTNFTTGVKDFRRIIDNQTFLPLYGKTISVGVNLDITLLTGMHEQSPILKSGDLDNRIKRVIDALRAPQQKGELYGDLKENKRWHCLLEDDDAVIGLKAKAGTFLDSDNNKESFVFIKVTPAPLTVTMSNIAMLF